MNKDEKLKALDAALIQIEKAYGKGSVMKLGDSRVNLNIETIPTGAGAGRGAEGESGRGVRPGIQR